MSEHIKDFYEKMYSSSREEPPHGFVFRRLQAFETSRYDVVFKLLPGGEKLLDVGCGNGNFALRARGKYEEVHGVDIAQTNIEAALRNSQKQGVEKTHFLQVDADSRLPYEDSFFSTVTCIASLQFMFDPYHVVSEFNRVLKKGGTLIVQVVNTAYLPRRLALLCGQFPVTARQTGWDGGTLHYFTFSSCARLLTEKGFSIACKTNSGVLAGWRRLWPSLLAADIIIKGIKK